MSAAFSRAEYLRTGQRTLLEIPTWSRAFKHVERPYTNEQARGVVLAHTAARDTAVPLDRRISPMVIHEPLFGFALAVDPFNTARWILLNVVVPEGCVVAEAAFVDSAPALFLTRTLDVHSFIALDPVTRRTYQTNSAMMPVSDYAYSLGVNKLPEGSMRQFAFKVDAGNVLQDAGVRLPVEVRTRVPDMGDDWKLPHVAAH